MNYVYEAIPPRMLTTATAHAAKSPALTFSELRNQIRQRRLSQGLSGNLARSLRLYPRLLGMLRCLVRLGSSFCLLIWDIDFFNDIVIRLSLIVTANAVCCNYHYAILVKINGTAVAAVIELNVEGKAPVIDATLNPWICSVAKSGFA